VSDIRQDLDELGQRLWPHSEALRPRRTAGESPGKRRRGLEPLAAVAAAVALIVVLSTVITLGRNQSPRPATAVPPQANAGPPVCVVLPARASANIAEYKVPSLGGIGQVTAGPDGNLWFVGGGGDSSNGLTEVVGRITPSGKVTLYHPPGNPGWSFDDIAAGADGNVWFTESTVDKIGRLAPATGRIDTFAVPLPPPAPSAQPLNTQITSIVAGPDGNLWFDVDQIALARVMPDGYVGRITPAGAATLYEIRGGGQPEGIQVGADGNLWSRIAASDSGPTSCGIPGYSPSGVVVRVTPAGRVTELGEASPQFAGYTVGPDGNHWWLNSAGTMRRTTPSGQVTDFPALTTLGFWDPAHFVFGSDGNIWYVDGSNIDRMTLAGDVSIYHARGGNSGATSITAGPDGRLWFAEGASGAATIGAIRPPGG
jgi:virginiamycin B lyase